MNPDQTLTDDRRWRAVKERDRRFDGRFVTGVLTTGIYCRPSCPARHPARANVRFFADGVQAQDAGLRPCKRCRPDDIARDEAAVLAAIAAIRSGERTTLEQLAAIAGYSPGHFQRLFKRAVGLSPAAFDRALREERAREALNRTDTVTQAVYQAGFEAPSRFYAALSGKMGMNASEWRKGGQGKTIHWTVIATSLGPMLVAATDRGVCRVAFGEDEPDLRRCFPLATLVEGGEAFRDLFGQVAKAVEQPASSVAIPLDVQGTAFQQRVWQALLEIPPGETRSYGELAAALGNPRASRAVGSANGANPVAVLLPCHRVIAADGKLGGYAYGEAIKRELLRRERMADPP